MDDRPPPADGLVRRFLDLEGHRVACVDRGQGPPIVFVHGNPCWSHVFREQIEAFRHRRRVVAPDLLGFGASAGPPRGASFVEQAEMLEALLLELGAREACLVVHDWGGPIGLRWAVRHPERVAALVLVNTTAAPDFAPPLYWRPLASELFAVRANALVLGLPLAMRAARRPREWALYRRAFRGEATRRAVLRLERLDGFREVVSEVAAGAAGLRCPIRILWGEPDFYFRRKDRERLERTFPTARCVVIRGAGHFPTADRPAEFNRHLDDFLSEPSRPRRDAAGEARR